MPKKHSDNNSLSSKIRKYFTRIRQYLTQNNKNQTSKHITTNPIMGAKTRGNTTHSSPITVTKHVAKTHVDEGPIIHTPPSPDIYHKIHKVDTSLAQGETPIPFPESLQIKPAQATVTNAAQLRVTIDTQTTNISTQIQSITGMQNTFRSHTVRLSHTQWNRQSSPKRTTATRHTHAQRIRKASSSRSR